LALQEDEHESERPNGQEWPNGDSAIKVAIPKPKSTDFRGNGRMAEGSTENAKKGASVDYEYSEEE